MRALAAALLSLSLAAHAAPKADGDDDKDEELHPVLFSAGLGWAAFVFNQANGGLDTGSAVATPGLALHVEWGHRLAEGSHWGLVGTADLAGASEAVIARYTAAAAIVGVALRYDEEEGLRVSLGLGAGGLLLHRGDNSTSLALAPIAHFEYPPPLFPSWLCLQGTFSYLPLPAPLRAFFAGVGVGVVY